MNTDLNPSWNPRTLARRESIAKFFRVGVTRVDWIPCEGARGERIWELGLLPEEDVKGWFFVDLDRMTCEICKDQLWAELGVDQETLHFIDCHRIADPWIEENGAQCEFCGKVAGQ